MSTAHAAGVADTRVDGGQCGFRRVANACVCATTNAYISMHVTLLKLLLCVLCVCLVEIHYMHPTAQCLPAAMAMHISNIFSLQLTSLHTSFIRTPPQWMLMIDRAALTKCVFGRHSWH